MLPATARGAAVSTDTCEQIAALAMQAMQLSTSQPQRRQVHWLKRRMLSKPTVSQT